MEKLNHFELAILEKLTENNPEIKKHIPFLEVKERKITETAMRVYISYSKGAEALDYIKKIHLSTNGNLKMEGLTHGLLDGTIITNGRIDLIELMTYDEPWDGVIRDFFWEETL